MKIHCTVCIVNRCLPNLPGNLRKKPCKSTLALCKHPNSEEFCFILFSGQNKNGTKYPLRNNIKQVLTRFVAEGKCTIQIKKPEHDLCIQGDPIQVKGFLHLVKRALEGKVSPKELTFSSMNVMPVKAKDIAPTKLVISKRQTHNLLLANISETVNTSANEAVHVPIDCYFCSLRCFSLAFYSRNRNPIVR
ncbi:hypothetical protein HUJ04_005095 [Dendroctonus ponderosae]|nr:hypothetical protein HUJ04_005095 [Dendroctonus ponderosae]